MSDEEPQRDTAVDEFIRLMSERLTNAEHERFGPLLNILDQFAMNDPYHHLEREIMRVSVGMGYLRENWVIGDWMIVCASQSPEAWDASKTAYHSIVPPKQAFHTSRGLLTHMLSRMEWSAFQQMAEQDDHDEDDDE